MNCSHSHKWYLRKLSATHALYVCNICDSGLNVDHPIGTTGIGLSNILLGIGGVLALGLSVAAWYLWGFLVAVVVGVITWWVIVPLILGRCLVRYLKRTINHLAENADRLGIDLDWRNLPECNNCGRRRTPTKRHAINYCVRCHPDGGAAAAIEELFGDIERH